MGKSSQAFVEAPGRREPRTALFVRLPKDLSTWLKIYAIREETTVQQIVTGVLEELRRNDPDGAPVDIRSI
jgi:hypothetical protein